MAKKKKQKQSKWIAAAGRLIRRFGMIFVVLVFVLWAGAWFFLSDADTKTAAWAKKQIVSATAALGFSVEAVVVEGLERTDETILLALLNTGEGDPVFAFDPQEAKDLIERITWVSRAHVERRLPGTIYVRIQERQPMALAANEKTLSLIDYEGQIIETDIKPFRGLISVSGQGAQGAAAGLFAVLDEYPGLKARIEKASFVSERRWDLITDRGIQVHLAEHNLKDTMQRLSDLQAREKILDKDILKIDLRQEDRIIVRTRPGSVQEYKETLKDAKKI